MRSSLDRTILDLTMLFPTSKQRGALYYPLQMRSGILFSRMSHVRGGVMNYVPMRCADEQVGRCKFPASPPAGELSHTYPPSPSSAYAILYHVLCFRTSAGCRCVCCFPPWLSEHLGILSSCAYRSEHPSRLCTRMHGKERR
jgi:hypothetical protein